jgi:6-pyruvoyltetrahydropterin/6-carboxytetrahydropterin synthase
VLLPVPNTTAELLARYIGRRLMNQLDARRIARPQRLRVGVDENNGQWGICEFSGLSTEADQEP